MSLTKAHAQQDRTLILGHHSFTLQNPWYKSSIREDVVYGPQLEGRWAVQWLPITSGKPVLRPT